MQIYYENSKGERLDLLSDKIAIQDIETLFENMWEYASTNSMIFGGKIKKFYKGVQTKSITVSLACDSEEEFTELCKEIEDTFFYDVQTNKPGKLYVNSSYLSCYIFESSYTNYEDLFYMTDRSFTIVTEYPNWIEEMRKSITATISTSNAVAGLAVVGRAVAGVDNTPTTESIEAYINNDQPMPCNYRMTLHGPVDLPMLTIGANIYNIDTYVDDDETLVIDSLEKTALQYDANGIPSNVFHLRDPQYQLFEKIQPGLQEVIYSGISPIDFILYKERGEPSWS